MHLLSISLLREQFFIQFFLFSSSAITCQHIPFTTNSEINGQLIVQREREGDMRSFASNIYLNCTYARSNADKRPWDKKASRNC